MGLDWCVMSRNDGGKEIHPLESIGGVRVSREDPESVAQFEKLIETNLGMYVESGETAHSRFWGRPLDVLIDEFIGTVLPPPVDKLPGYCGTGSFASAVTDWRGARLRHCPIIGLELQGEAYQDMDPQVALDYASRLSDMVDAAEIKLVDSGDKEDEDSCSISEQIETVKEAAAFLQFWAEKGHGIHAWY